MMLLFLGIILLYEALCLKMIELLDSKVEQFIREAMMKAVNAVTEYQSDKAVWTGGWNKQIPTDLGEYFILSDKAGYVQSRRFRYAAASTQVQ
jgi:hypothetical protein